MSDLLSPKQMIMIDEIRENFYDAVAFLKNEFDANNPENRHPEGGVTSFVLPLHDPNEIAYKRPGGSLLIIEKYIEKNKLTDFTIVTMQEFKNSENHICQLTETITTDCVVHTSKEKGGVLYKRDILDQETGKIVACDALLILPGDDQEKVFLMDAQKNVSTEIGSLKYFCDKLMEIKTQFGCANPQAPVAYRRRETPSHNK